MKQRRTRTRTRTRWARFHAALLCGALLGGAVGGAAGCDATYQDNDLELLTRYRAKDMCSCLFVMGRGKDYCSRWTRQPPNLATYTIDWDRQEVRTQAMMYWGARARFVDEHFGCLLQ